MIERTDLPAGMLSFPSIARYLREQLLYLGIAAVVAAVLWAIDQPYNNAGHPPPKLVSSNSIRELSGTGAVLGVFPAWKYENSIVALTSGDRLLLFTDGITEASQVLTVRSSVRKIWRRWQKPTAPAPLSS